MIIDAHLHLWEKQNGIAKGLRNGRSLFDGEVRQMMPPYMINGANTAEMLISNMDYAGVLGAVVTQEYLDGSQDNYLLKCKEKYDNRLKICSLYEEGKPIKLNGFDGVKIPAQRLSDKNLYNIIDVFKEIEKSGKFLSIDLCDGDCQTGYMTDIIAECPKLKIAIGHFGMITKENWQEQVKLARNKNVYIESGGITWLYDYEFYPYPTAVKAILSAIDICSADKLMWGSDYPRTMVEITYKMSFDFVLKSNEIIDVDKKKFLGENAVKFYGFEDLEIVPTIKNML